MTDENEHLIAENATLKRQRDMLLKVAAEARATVSWVPSGDAECSAWVSAADELLQKIAAIAAVEGGEMNRELYHFIIAVCIWWALIFLAMWFI